MKFGIVWRVIGEKVEKTKLSFSWITSWEEFKIWESSTNLAIRRTYELEILNLYVSSGKPFLYLTGECSFCAKSSNFLLDDIFGRGNRSELDFEPNWRERLICSRCNLNNRIRMVYSYICDSSSNDRVWITEQSTSFFRALSTKFNHIVGSEFLGTDLASGTIHVNGVRHEDLTKSSFKDSSFDLVITLDVLEHVESNAEALSEIYRVLKTGGKLVATFPFDRSNSKNFERVRRNDDNSLTFFAPPEYHGNPASSEPILCFRHFGWQILQDLKDVGFSDSRIGLSWSESFMNLGPEQVLLVATK